MNIVAITLAILLSVILVLIYSSTKTEKFTVLSANMNEADLPQRMSMGGGGLLKKPFQKLNNLSSIV